MNYISIGGWCGTKMSLKSLVNEATLPFDYVRSSIEGIIDCIENDFQNFFPNEIKIDNRFYPKWVGFVGEYIGFYHNDHNLFDEKVIESFKRKIIRFDEKIKKNNCIFLRTIVSVHYEDEIKQYKKLQDAIDKKYPNISYIICFIILNQPKTQYYKHLDDRTFLFTLNNTPNHYINIENEYKPIYDFLINNNLFNNKPLPNNIEILNNPSYEFWFVDGFPMVNYIEKL